MACQPNCDNQHKPRHFDYVTIIVLYILLAIIIGTCAW